jgi:hypothetical protein
MEGGECRPVNKLSAALTFVAANHVSIIRWIVAGQYLKFVNSLATRTCTKTSALSNHELCLLILMSDCHYV